MIDAIGLHFNKVVQCMQANRLAPVCAAVQGVAD